MRAVAVTVVILDHLIGWPAGGFVGVDVFFVISGYLITSLMVHEQDRAGRVSWTGFYRRRVKRIVPAATVVLVATVVAAYFLYRVSQFEAIAGQAFWAFVFMSNWQFAMIGTDYFMAAGPVSPLQHFWSLSVEEQFYIVWPVLLILVFGMSRRRNIGARGAGFIPAAVIGTLALTSFAWAMVDTAENPTWAYFSTFSRSWELAVGALLAVVIPLTRIPTRLPAVVRTLLCYLGLTGILVSLLVINPQSAFPGPWAALPVLSAAVIIVAGAGGAPRGIAPLTNPASVYVGRISYSLYLWHFPVIVLLAAVFVDKSLNYYLCCIAAISFLSMASFHLIEDPIRQSAWLEPSSKKARIRRRAKRRRRSGRTMTIAIALGVAAPVLGLAMLTAIGDHSVDSATITAELDAERASASVPADAGAGALLTADVNRALSSTEWPADLAPSLDTLDADDRAPEWVTDHCLGGEPGADPDPATNSAHCTYGSDGATKTAVLLGDSVAISYLPGIRAALEPAGYRITVMTLQQCPVSQLDVLVSSGAPHQQCGPFRQWTFDQVARAHPDLVLFATAENTIGRIVEDANQSDPFSHYQAGLKVSLGQLAGSAGRVLLLAPPPGTKGLRDCAIQASVPADCEGRPSDWYRQLVPIERTTALAAGPNIAYIPTQSWFCARNRCPAFIGTAPTYVDGTHLTAAMSRRLGPVIAQVVLDGADSAAHGRDEAGVVPTTG